MQTLITYSLLGSLLVWDFVLGTARLAAASVPFTIDSHDGDTFSSVQSVTNAGQV